MNGSGESPLVLHLSVLRKYYGDIFVGPTSGSNIYNESILREIQLWRQYLHHNNSLQPSYIVNNADNNTADYYVQSEPLMTVITMTLVYAIILITGVLGNVCTCLVIAKNRYMHTATNYYLFSLSVSDLLLLLTGLPQEMHQLWHKQQPYAFGETFCILRGLTSEMSTNASILTITAFTVERYVAICHPLRAHTMCKLSRAIKTILVIWLVAATFGLPLALQLGIVFQKNELTDEDIPGTASCDVARPIKHAFFISTFLFFVLPISVISVLYVLIAIQLRRANSAHGQDYSPEDSKALNGGSKSGLGSTKSIKCKTPRHTGGGSKRAVVKMLVAVVVSFIVCWTPFHAQRLIATYAVPSPIMSTVYSILYPISGVTYYLSATLNPILYQVMSLKFRQAFRDTFGGRISWWLCYCCGFRRRRSDLKHETTTYCTTASFCNHNSSVISRNNSDRFTTMLDRMPSSRSERISYSSHDLAASVRGGVTQSGEAPDVMLDDNGHLTVKGERLSKRRSSRSCTDIRTAEEGEVRNENVQSVSASVEEKDSSLQYANNHNDSESPLIVTSKV